MPNEMPGISIRRPKRYWKRWLAGSLLFLVILSLGVLWLRSRFFSGPQRAPEANRVLALQEGLPFQVLIPAYLPNTFNRNKVRIIKEQTDPHGKELIRLIYSTRKGDTLSLSEWLPADQDPERVTGYTKQYLYVYRTVHQRSLIGADLNKDPMRVKVELSAPNLLPYDEFEFVLYTLGPATNDRVDSLPAAPSLSATAPPAVEIPVNPDGVQELTLVISPEGYSPESFAVKKDVPVRLIFRQHGYVYCGNELLISWSSRESPFDQSGCATDLTLESGGMRESAWLILESESDSRVLEFTPKEAGQFRYHCAHFLFDIGTMVVKE